MVIEKAIFLDIDGVLATVKQFGMKRTAKTYLHDYDCYPFDEKCVKVFNEILEATKPDVIILSSDWQTHYGINEIKSIFEINGVNQVPTFITKEILNPNFKFSMIYDSLEVNRAREIQNFLDSDEHDIKNYIVIDDLDLRHNFPNNFVYCSSEYEGIKKNGLKEKSIKILNK